MSIYNTVRSVLDKSICKDFEWKEVKPMLFSPKEKGQGMVEYALIIVLIAIVVIVVLTVLGTQISTVFSQISSAMVR